MELIAVHLDQMTEQEILEAEECGDEAVIDRMSTRLRMLVAAIEATRAKSPVVRFGIANSPANRLACRRASEKLPGVTVGIRIF